MYKHNLSLMQYLQFTCTAQLLITECTYALMRRLTLAPINIGLTTMNCYAALYVQSAQNVPDFTPAVTYLTSWPHT